MEIIFLRVYLGHWGANIQPAYMIRYFVVVETRHQTESWERRKTKDKVGAWLARSFPLSLSPFRGPPAGAT